MAVPYTKSDAVRNLQRYLRRLSYEENGIHPVPVDGIFESRTEEALSEFQRGAGLPVTGIADRLTWDALFAEYTRLIDRDRSVPVDFFLGTWEDDEPVMGESHALITLLQFMLSELTLVYDAYLPLPLSGVYDEETEDAVRQFQRIHGLPPTGRADRLTRNRLSEEYRNYLT